MYINLFMSYHKTDLIFFTLIVIRYNRTGGNIKCLREKSVIYYDVWNTKMAKNMKMINDTKNRLFRLKPNPLPPPPLP